MVIKSQIHRSQSALKYANESVEFTLDMISEDEIKMKA